MNVEPRNHGDFESENPLMSLFSDPLFFPPTFQGLLSGRRHPEDSVT